MNQFVELFADRVKGFWQTPSDDQKKELLADILTFANSNPQSFKQDLDKVLFDKNITPLPVVLEALSKDADTWGQFYIDTLDKIFEQAKQTEKPNDILTNLMEFAYIEKTNRPFVQRIVDRLHKETDSGNLSTKLAAISTLPPFLTNPSVRNRSQITDSLQQKLHDKNWKVRYVAFTSLGYEDILPAGHKLSLADQLRKLVFGTPPTL